MIVKFNGDHKSAFTNLSDTPYNLFSLTFPLYRGILVGGFPEQIYSKSSRKLAEAGNIHFLK